MNSWLWLLVGLSLGALNAASIARTVGKLRPEANVRALSAVASGFMLRLILSVLVLAVALRQSAAAGLLAIAGIWFGRWTVLFWTNAKVAA